MNSNSKTATLIDELETFNKLLLFNDTQEQIIYILPQKSMLFAVTIKQKLRGDGKIDVFDLNGYFFDKRTNGVNTKRNPINMHCGVVYNNERSCLSNVRLIDFTVDKQWQNQGYGSIVMEQLIKFAKYMNAPYISGSISFVDIGVNDDDETKRENRERLYHFYPKFGFELDKNKETIRLDLTK